MDKNSKIYVAGHGGMVGGAIVRNLKSKGFSDIIGKRSCELDLINQQAVEDFFATEKPQYVFMAAAKVGGINANNTYPAEFIYQNMMIEANVINAAYKNGVKKMIFMGSGCIYPRIVPQPIKEEYLLSAALEKTNEPYAIAKIAGLTLCSSYNRQYGTNYISLMPCNLFGEGDSYSLKNSHVVPALIRKIYEAKTENKEFVTIWGTGKAMREFMHVDDLAEAAYFVMQKDVPYPLLNVGQGSDITIAELARILCDIIEYKGKICFDASMPDGTPRKLLDSSKLFSLGWKPKISVEEGLKRVYLDYLSNKDNYRK